MSSHWETESMKRKMRRFISLTDVLCWIQQSDSVLGRHQPPEPSKVAGKIHPCVKELKLNMLPVFLCQSVFET